MPNRTGARCYEIMHQHKKFELEEKQKDVQQRTYFVVLINHGYGQHPLTVLNELSINEVLAFPYFTTPSSTNCLPG
ncbi:hypothetical protein DGG96_19985 [Legionella qingyii]|uniref:Uncharacterized protein n=1 Tax=Legionella qingyii TaxID=2184757 RepID=A0A317TWX1_9GAMM|nr:hypothetical protein DGG96_19985 [Legionella qingyii]